MKFGLRLVEAVGYLAIFRTGVIEFSHAVGERFLFRFQRTHIVEDGKTLAKHRASGELQTILRKIAGSDAFRERDGAVIEAFDLRQDFEERGFAGAVGAYDADALARGDQPV